MKTFATQHLDSQTNNSICTDVPAGICMQSDFLPDGQVIHYPFMSYGVASLLFLCTQGLAAVSSLNLGTVVSWLVHNGVSDPSLGVVIMGFSNTNNDVSKPDAVALFSCTDSSQVHLPMSVCK